MLNFKSIIVFSDRPQTLVDFYKKVLQTEVEWSGGEMQSLPAGQGFILFGPHSKVHGKNMTPERILFNLEAEDVKAEFERIKKIEGATVIQDPYHPSEDDEDSPEALVATFADPDGNFFQLESPFPGDK